MIGAQKLNPPQAEAVAHRGGPLLVVSGAGTGKTRVITHRIVSLINEGVPADRILAVTFTNKAAEEMRKRIDEMAPGQGSLVWMHTFHAFCAKLLRQHAGALKLSRYFTIYDQDDQKRLIVETMKELGWEDRKNKAGQFLGMISRAKDDLLDAKSYSIHAMASIDAFRQNVAKVYELYQAKLEKAGALDFGDLLVKACELLKENQAIREYYQELFLHVLVDEYQDTNHAQYILTKTLGAKHKNVCVVGDEDQCLAPGTRVSTPSGPVPIEKLRDGDLVVAGSGWGKLQVVPIQKVMRSAYEGPLFRIRFKSGRTLSATPNHICFGRLVPREGIHYVYLMRKNGVGYRIGITSGIRTSKNGLLMNGLCVRTNQEVADAMWIIRACSSAAEARYYEQNYSISYGIPTLVFHDKGRKLSLDQPWIDRLYKTIDTDAAAHYLMRDFHLDPNFPHHRPGAVIRGDVSRKVVSFTAFGDPRDFRWHEHRVQLVTSDKDLKRAALAAGFPVRAGNRGTWRIETSRNHYDDAKALARSICGLDALEFVGRARLTADDPYFFMPASHLRPGMVVPALDGDRVVEDEVAAVERESYKGFVYDLSIPEFRNFAAQGVFVHNSVYAWRGANIRNILEFEHDFKDAKVIRLEQNYRSTPNILNAASCVIANNRQRKPKTLWTERSAGEPVQVWQAFNEADEARWVVSSILSRIERGASLKDIAIFYRTNAQSRQFEDALRLARLPHKVVGAMRFYERKEIKDALAYARVAMNPADSISLARILNVPPRGIGKTSQEYLQELARHKGLTLLEAMAREGEAPKLTNAARQGCRELVHLFAQLKADMETLPASQAMMRVVERSGYVQWLENEGESDPEALGRLDNLQELLNAVKDFEERAGKDDNRLERFLEGVTLQSDADTVDGQASAITLMTVHIAKGLEFPIVYLTGMEEGLFPIGSGNATPDELEEERRLCYVGMTRAKEQLFLTYAASRRTYGTRYDNMASRFILEARLSPTSQAPLAAPRRTSFVGEEDQTWSEFSEPAAPLAARAAEEGPRHRLQAVKIGMRVRHAQFGTGRIIEKSGHGEALKVTIAFDGGSTKKLILRYAPLEPA